MDFSPQRARALPVHEADLENSFLAAFPQIAGDQIADIAGQKGVKIKYPVDGDLNRVVLCFHRLNITSSVAFPAPFFSV